MRWTPWLFGSLAVAVMTACGGNKGNNNTGSGSESGTMQGGTASDTGMAATDTASGGMSGMRSDTATGGGRMHSDTNQAGARSSTGAMRSSDSAKGNQTKSGVTNTETGKSTLGKGATKTRPDQGQPVTSKGDTVSNGPDSTASNR